MSFREIVRSKVLPHFVVLVLIFISFNVVFGLVFQYSKDGERRMFMQDFSQRATKMQADIDSLRSEISMLGDGATNGFALGYKKGVLDAINGKVDVDGIGSVLFTPRDRNILRGVNESVRKAWDNQ